MYNDEYMSLSKPTECTIPGINPNVDFEWKWWTNVGSSVIINVPLWSGMLDNGRGYACVGTGGTQENLC